MAVNQENIDNIGKVLNDKNSTLKKRFRALFTLKNLGSFRSIAWIAKCFSDPSELLRHECAYCLGQMQDSRAIPFLIDILINKNVEAIVRHEAAEALGAIGCIDAIPVLQRFANDRVKEVSETCQIAIGRLKWFENLNQEEISALSVSSFASVDPAPPSPENDVIKLKGILLNEQLPIFDRYRAMFALRNRGDESAVLILSEGLKCSSTLFRHEIAFVLGQLQHEASIPYLIASLENREESPMVRHECAEALGSIATDRCNKILEQYLNDEETLVRESCIVALDISQYENSDQFQYADGLINKSQGDGL